MVIYAAVIMLENLGHVVWGLQKICISNCAVQVVPKTILPSGKSSQICCLVSATNGENLYFHRETVFKNLGSYFRYFIIGLLMVKLVLNCTVLFK